MSAKDIVPTAVIKPRSSNSWGMICVWFWNMTKEADNQNTENNNGLSVPVSLQSGPSAGEWGGAGGCVCVCVCMYLCACVCLSWSVLHVFKENCFMCFLFSLYHKSTSVLQSSTLNNIICLPLRPHSLSTPPPIRWVSWHRLTLL